MQTLTEKYLLWDFNKLPCYFPYNTSWRYLLHFDQQWQYQTMDIIRGKFVEEWMNEWKIARFLKDDIFVYLFCVLSDSKVKMTHGIFSAVCIQSITLLFCSYLVLIRIFLPFSLSTVVSVKCPVVRVAACKCFYVHWVWLTADRIYLMILIK